MSAVPVITQPDAEAWVWANIGTVHGVTAWAYAAVQQERLGWGYAHFIQVDARAKTKPQARDLAERVRQIMVALPDAGWPDGVISYVQPVEGPFYAAGDPPPCYIARYEIRVHPRRTATEALIAEEAAGGTAGEEQ